MLDEQALYLSQLHHSDLCSSRTIDIKVRHKSLEQLFVLFPNGNTGYDVNTGEVVFFTNLKKEGLHDSTNINC